MSAKNGFWANVFLFFLCSFLGCALAAACIVGTAYWMIQSGNPAAAVPMAVGSVCVGSTFSGGLAAFVKRENGLLNGLIQGVFFAGALILANLFWGTQNADVLLVRCILAILFGGLGGFSGVSLRMRKNR